MKKSKNMNTAWPIEAVQFNVRYADIRAAARLVRDELKKNLSFVRKLGKRAQKLYRYGDSKCYIHTSRSVCRPVYGIKDLGAKMDNLEWLCSVDLELDDFIKDFGEI